MKAKRISLMTGSLLPVLVGALILITSTACEEDPPIFKENFAKTEALSAGNYMTQNFWVSPEGSTVNLFEGAIELIFPEGAVPKFTEFTIANFPAHYLDLDGYNLYCWGFSLEADYQGYMFPKGVTFNIRYDMTEKSWSKDLPASEEEIQIYRVSPTPWSYERVVPFEACCVDCNCKMVKGCADKCGYFVIGE